MKLLNIYLLLTLGCSENQDTELPLVGAYSKQYVFSLNVFNENISEILKNSNITLDNFIKLSNSKARELKSAEHDALKSVRVAIYMPCPKALLQKIISLDKVGTYINNGCGGRIRGIGEGCVWYSC